MNTPICDFVAAYAKRKTLRLHMPGHKGYTLLGVEELDITEIDGADVLYSADGIIKESRENAAALFGAGATFYSAEGSSLAVRAMLYLSVLYAKEKGREPVIAAARNAHKSFVGASALLGITPLWIYPREDSSLISCHITESELEAFLENENGRVTAVYLTSPDYLGNTADVESLARAAKRHGALLLVDNAHGAYLAFLEKNRHPMALGADMCCDSAHKTLPALTGAAYLHISKSAPKMLAERAEEAMSLFASTSPSYLILASLDKLNAYLSSGYRERLCSFSEKLSDMRERLEGAGYATVGDEALKLALATKAYGYLGGDFARLLSERGFVIEFSDRDFAVMMLSPDTHDAELSRLEGALLSIPRRSPITEAPPRAPRPKRKLSPREGMLALSEQIPVTHSLGRTLASVSVSCPPAVPIAVFGEEIDGEVIAAFQYYGVEKCRVVK